MIIYLVIIMTINGQDFVKRMSMDSEELCWQNAASVFKQLREEHGEELTGLGVGCVFKKDGDPA